MEFRIYSVTLETQICETLPLSSVLKKICNKFADVKFRVVFIFLLPSTILSSTVVISGVSSHLPFQSNYIHRFLGNIEIEVDEASSVDDKP